MTHKPIPPSPESFVAYIVIARGRNGDGVLLIWDYDVPGNGLETNTAAAFGWQRRLDSHDLGGNIDVQFLPPESAPVTVRLIELALPSHDVSLTSNFISPAHSEPEAQMRRLAFHRDGRLSYRVDWDRVAAATALELTE
jgi:hypothetical protein